MKKFILLSLFIALTLSTHTKDIQSFVEGFGKAFDYNVTDEISKCFKGANEEIVWDFFKLVNTYSIGIRDGKFNGFMVSAVGLWHVGMKLEKEFKCMYETKDFQKLLKHLKVDFKNHLLFCEHLMLFMDSYPKIMSFIMTGIVEKIEKKDFYDGGKIFGESIVDLSKHDYDINTMRVTSFLNGIFLRNEVMVPDSLRSSCLEKQDSIRHILLFFKDWSVSLKGVKNRSKIIRETFMYFAKGGLKHYESLDKKLVTCMNESPDIGRFVDKVGHGLDPYDAAFDFDFANFLAVDKHIDRYWRLMKNIRVLLHRKPHFYLLAGINYGTLLKEVSKGGVN